MIAAVFPRLSQPGLRPVHNAARRILGCDHLAEDAFDNCPVNGQNIAFFLSDGAANQGECNEGDCAAQLTEAQN